MQPSGAVQSAIRESDQALCRQIAEWEPLEFGVAHYAPQFATLPAANQLRDAWLAKVDGDEAYRRAEDFYRARGLTCWLWTPAAAQPTEPLEALLSPMGWRRIDATVMGLAHWDAATPAPDPGIRILPARAMHRAYQESFIAEAAERGERHEEIVEAALQRLDDANYDAFVAVADHQPLGRMGYHEVGDMARLADLFLLPAHRRRGVGGELVRHFLRLARRLSPRVVAATVEPGNDAARALLEKFGFAAAGTQTEFRRPRGG